MTRDGGDVWTSRRRHPTARPVAPAPRSKVYAGLLAIVVTLNLLGLVMVMSASSVIALDKFGSAWYVVARQGMWLVFGVSACGVVLRIDYHRWRPLAVPALAVSVGLLLLVLVPGVGTKVNGATRWLGFGQFSLQPSELAKLTILLFIADLLARRAAWMDDLHLILTSVGLKLDLHMLVIVDAVLQLDPFEHVLADALRIEVCPRAHRWLLDVAILHGLRQVIAVNNVLERLRGSAH